MRLQRNIYCSPKTKDALDCQPDDVRGDEVLSGTLSTAGSPVYRIVDGIPDFLRQDELAAAQAESLSYYEKAASVYDDVAHLSFAIQCCDEESARKKFVDLLSLRADHRVLELACGTGRDSENIACALGAGGAYYLQDICRPMLERCREKLRDASVPTEFSVGDACSLPFPSKSFDAIFSFGGLGVFGNPEASLREMVRVAKVGARVVVGDESMAPWLYDTEYGRILLNHNPLFRAEVPLKYLPSCARDVRMQWVVGGVYYLIDFTVGEGEPPLDADLAIPGIRGGTLRTRYEGKLEGVTPETLRLAQRAREKSGKSMHTWLDTTVRRAALSELEVDPSVKAK